MSMCLGTRAQVPGTSGGLRLGELTNNEHKHTLGKLLLPSILLVEEVNILRLLVQVWNG